VISQEGFDGLPKGVIPVEVALVGEAIDLRFKDLYQGQVDPAALARAMCLHPCRGGGTSFSHCGFSIAFGTQGRGLSGLIREEFPHT
jgi:hypothetical protein